MQQQIVRFIGMILHQLLVSLLLAQEMKLMSHQVILILPTASQRKKATASSEATQEMEMQMEHLFIQGLNQLLL